MASTYLFRANGSPTGTTKGTISVWFKRSALGSAQYLYGAYVNSTNRFKIELNTSDIVEINNINGGSDTIIMNTNRKFRDTSAWYHLVFKVDTTQGTEADRVKLYINGVQETSFSSVTYPSQDDTNWKALNSSSTIDIGAYNNGGGSSAGSRTSTWDGLMSHYHFTDGYAYDASTFGSTDSTTGEWKINTSPSITMGNNGFTILKDGNTYTDQSANSNNFTLSGTLTNTEDCPSNVFATLNPLQGGQAGTMGLIEGNLYLSGNGTSSWRAIGATLADNSGKYYWEAKCIGNSGGTTIRAGICDVEQMPVAAGTKFTSQSRGWGITTGGNVTNNDSSVGGWTGTSWTTNDILMFALDLTNSKFYIGKNGTWMNSGDPTTGSTGTGALSITSGYYYTPAHENYDAAANFAYNFGNGYFRTTAISSEGTNASGIGKFEYDVPANYTALSTKGLNE